MMEAMEEEEETGEMKQDIIKKNNREIQGNPTYGYIHLRT